MSIKKWKVTAEVNMCSNNEESIIVLANSERKAKKIATEKMLKHYFYVSIRSCKELREDN